MSELSGGSEAESGPKAKPKLSVDAELDEVETYSDLAERGYLVREVMEDLLDRYSPLSRDGSMRELIAGVEPGVELKILPGIPGKGVEGNDIAAVRTYEYNPREQSFLTRLQATDRYLVGEVPQGYAWEISDTRSVYLRCNMSVCSLVLGKAEDGTLVASHVSYSEMAALAGTMSLMAKHGIPANQVRVVASLGWQPYLQADHSYSTPEIHEAFRPAIKEDYLLAGVAEGNLYPFAFGLESGLEPGDWNNYNLAQVIVSRDFIYFYNSDYDSKARRQSTYRNETAVAW